ncbi:muts domain V-domain-containing protein [Epithele typhae]|uniref:muts domain V-domain-containing protein n=1 Tax=Epithele typhae TaxID=378194 RepID=UPI002008E1AB|nr:muts domain V-domain-containing protein [Epithele typhae]KAH9939032.1 muts domain V-domain-containing protein [Epithele typhae]
MRSCLCRAHVIEIPSQLVRSSASLFPLLPHVHHHDNNRPTSSRPTTSVSRPRTPRSRPNTARPLTATSSRHESSHIIAVIEGRGVAREVGIACLDKDTGRVNLVQLADCPTYVKTLHQMHLHYPSIVLVPDTFVSLSDSHAASGKKPQTTSLLVQYIMDEFEGVSIEPVMRKYWSDNAGLDFVNQLMVEDDERAATLVAVSNKYYALSAASALFKYAELRLNTRFAAASLRIKFAQVDGTMMIDSDSARNLELVGNMTGRKNAHSLFGLLNHTYTAMGARLLRVNILAPITVRASLDARLDVVEELIQTEYRFTEIKSALKALNKMDFDKLISALASSEVRDTSTAKTASSRVAQMLVLRNVVQTMPKLAAALEGSRSQLLQIIAAMISDRRLANIDALICRSLNEEATPAKGGLNAVNSRVYAVRANFNRLLDVARETYKENVGDIYALRNRLVDEHGLPITLVYRDGDGGFVLALKKSDLENDGGQMPTGFVDMTAQKGRWVFSSIELKKRNARMKDALDETLILSNKIIQDLTDEIVVDIGALYKASEAVALLDVLWSFAHASIPRPEFTGTLAIKAGRHPVLETVQSAGATVANDVYCCEASSFQIVQGPNMSGKTTYLKQIALLTVMALCGCFIPAEYGSFRRVPVCRGSVISIHDSLLTRLSNDDDLEKSLSTFANEMASSAMILGLATQNTLVLIDEVGRGTSVREGVGISHAIAEELIKLKAFVFFATHFTELTTTLSRHPSRSASTTSKFGLTFHYKILDGAQDDLAHYGKSRLDLAKLADLPAPVITEARRVAEYLSDKEAREQQESRSHKLTIRRKALLKLKTQLGQALDHSTLPDEELAHYLLRVQKDITAVLKETM